ncbi:Rrf2 family transcriptional regulator [Candidatus Bipolaricaulota bacterium]|nr:Rrf2 family transcriptional regulator [Candidatus Bipolaricaulota bacterium]TFH09494.1 MAG: Rrf2 family transcriptional regulator [Candidatus Atribacteria bacterium]
MNLTKKSSYGLIATLELAHASEAAPQSASSIAEQYSLPVSFIEKILHELRHAGLVRSKQGRTGGYFLARPPQDISVRDVLEALGESLDLVGCLNSASHCGLTDCCPTQGAWRHIDTRFKRLLDSLSLQSLLHSEDLTP